MPTRLGFQTRDEARRERRAQIALQRRNDADLNYQLTTIGDNLEPHIEAILMELVEARAGWFNRLWHKIFGVGRERQGIWNRSWTVMAFSTIWLSRAGDGYYLSVSGTSNKVELERVLAKVMEETGNVRYLDRSLVKEYLPHLATNEADPVSA
jgi:hypothetical protein